MSAFAVVSFVPIALTARVVLAALARVPFGAGLFHGGVVFVHDDDRVTAAFAMFLLGVARVGGARVVRVVRVFGPAFFVALVAFVPLLVTAFAVFYNNDWLRGGRWFACYVARS